MEEEEPTLDAIIDCFFVYIVDPICDLFQGKVKFTFWLLNTFIGLLTTFLLVAAVGGTAWYWLEGDETLAILCGVAAALLLVFDGWRISYWRKETKKDE
jgi:hypothetical protein